MEQAKTILVLDSSEQVRGQLREMLTRYGYQVLETGSPSRALEHLGKDNVDLVIVEVDTPGEGEDSIIKELRDASAHEEVPLIALATTQQVDEVARWVRGGCNDFLLKPVNPRLLFQRVQSLIEANPRAYNRVSCNVVAEGTTGAQHFTGELKEVGEGGASFVLDRQLAKDDILKLTFTLPRRPGVLTLGAGIIHVHQADGRYVHGLKFIIIDHQTRDRIKSFVLEELGLV